MLSNKKEPKKLFKAVKKKLGGFGGFTRNVVPLDYVNTIFGQVSTEIKKKKLALQLKLFKTNFWGPILAGSGGYYHTTSKYLSFKC